MAEQELISVELAALVEDQATLSPIVLLLDRKANRLLPIWIGDPEARAIAVALNHMQTPRPLTHTLLLTIVANMGGKLSRVVIDRIKSHTYYASIYIEVLQPDASKKTVKIDSRPSDSIAVALEAKVPIFVAREVMDEAGQPNPFPGFSARQEKRELKLKPEELDKLKALLERAREREQASGGS